ncbi:aAA ATPase [Clostridium sp. CAG:508]|jgi:putative ATPase|nr:replication-associated recombination protein A [Clostridia bacterium]CDC31320.1 aAA ATPase [Clostridium sp. CAG:508]
MDMSKPLAYRMSPKTLDDYVGQEHILGKDKILYRTIKADRLSSIILWGPPGCGKTSLARVISNTTKCKFLKINAVTSGISDIKNAVETAQNALLNPSGKCILFIDEIHRFNKLQQDALLPYVENGTIILIGATTENPYFEVNKALISRSMVFHLQPLTDEDIFKVLKKSLTSEDGLGSYNIKIEDETLKKLAITSGGDVRTALNGLEVAVLTTQIDSNGIINITDDILKECVQTRKAVFDKKGDSHYDNISAFIKSMRGSDVDAALFYLARALNAGEDPVFMARRIVIAAAEDVGMANPNALVVATSAMQAVTMVGMPEARIILAEATVYVATSKKSNAAYLGIDKALADVANKDTGTIPMHIRNAPAEGMSKEGYGVGYKYPHDYPNHWVEQQYLPDKMLGTKYYIKDDTVED